MSYETKCSTCLLDLKHTHNDIHPTIADETQTMKICVSVKKKKKVKERLKSLVLVL